MAATLKLFQTSRVFSGGGVSELGCGFARGMRRRKGKRGVGFGVWSEMQRDKKRNKEVVMRKEEGAAAAVVVVDGGVGEMLRFGNGRDWSGGVRWSSLKIQLQRFIEKGILDCRFFTLLAVGGSLLGSVLCFLEGCVVIVKCYAQYFHNMGHRSGQGHIIELLIEAIDMFLVGTSMLMFGMGLYAMFIGSKSVKGQMLYLPKSNLFGLFSFRATPAWAQMNSVSQIKSKMGHAIMMVLQVGVLDKLKNVPVGTGLDIACFAGVVLLSSVCVFLLSKLSSNDAANYTLVGTRTKL